ncbi:hypothetical protein I547_5392 [Mycobacterium kansasii 824]|nr:hypothetical protein I547_5392 [Mycobacterium kansasii 824]
MSVCHTYYYLWPGMGNVSNMIWDGDDPPPKPPGSGYQPPAATSAGVVLAHRQLHSRADSVPVVTICGSTSMP